MPPDSGNRSPADPGARPPLHRFTADREESAQFEELVAALRDCYEIRREVGYGGSAYVYLATDLRTGDDVAIKVLRSGYAVALGNARFQREIEIAGRLRHPNILAILDVGSAAGRRYYTMPYVDGETLRTRIARERHMAMEEVLNIARAVAAALDYAHTEGVIHRDIKPGNILLQPDATLVADFGIARPITVLSGERLTDSDVIVGTPEYMSPEQAAGDRKLDGRSDVYALGSVVYEMLAGEAPFTGPSPQAVIARVCTDSPRSIRIIRPSLPRGVENAIRRALAKVPADRFRTATQFVDALEAGIAEPPEVPKPLAPRPRSRALIAAAATVALLAGTAIVLNLRGPTLDTDRIVVFPLNQAGASSGAAGEEIAMLIGYALDGTRPLKWTDGWELLTPAQRAHGGRLDTRVARELAREAGAGFFIDGSILYRPDSVRVLLRLHNVTRDSTVRLVERSAPASFVSVPQLGLAAVQLLLPDLVAPGGRVDVTALTDRRPAAVANFLQGEREYRRMQFAAALPHYRAAIRDDSVFALAALRGAYTAAWLSDVSAAVELVGTALRSVSSLTPPQAAVGRGMYSYLEGDADSSLVFLRDAVRQDPEAPEAWTLLGETYSRLLPNELAADSLARSALERARAIDHDFSPALVLLEELALRDGDVDRASRLRQELRSAGADTTHVMARDLMFRCVQRGSDGIDWAEAARRDYEAVLSVGKVLGGRAANPGCAEAAFRALLATTDPPVPARLGALMGLQAQLIATGRAGETPRSLGEKGVAGLDYRLRIPILVGAATGDGFQRQAQAVADSAAILGYDRASASMLWQLGYFEAHRGNVARVGEIARALQVKADSSQLPRDHRLARSVAARLHVLEGDTTAALEILKTLKPRARRVALGWWPWESLGPERLLLAQLLHSRGHFEEAHRVATYLDATEPIGYPMYLRPSLELRERAATKSGNKRLAEQYRQRLRRLEASGDLASASSY
jgi:serine/threonine protein kinase